VFLERAIDYAGLFAPASLDMMTSVRNYSRYFNDPYRWALGRFVLPVARLDEFLNARKVVAADPWRLSGIISADIEMDLAAVDEFNRKAHGAVIDSLEVRVCNLDQVDLVRKNRPPRTTVLFEIAIEQSDEFLPLLRDIGGCAKLRTGGVIEESFPSVDEVGGFLLRCAELGVPFKATAGLHHPLRSLRPLTYEPNSQQGFMHGFLNLLTAAAVAWGAVRSGRAVPRSMISTCLADEERANWHFGEDAMTWNGDNEPMRFDLHALQSMRSNFALSFGSCSFEEPLRDLRELDIL